MSERKAIAKNKDSLNRTTKTSTALLVGKSHSPQEREANAVADAIMEGRKFTLNSSRQTTSVKGEDQDNQTATDNVSSVVSSLGQSLRQKDKTFMEARFGHDFSRVRIHNDTQAAASAHSINARAYTYDNKIVFATGQYRPDSPAGRHLLAHELSHVVQHASQSPDHAAFIQRVGVFESIARFFGGGTFSESELLAYIDYLKTKKTIEDAYDSDNKAREVVSRWESGDASFAVLPVPVRILLIKEMASGYLSGADQNGILSLLEESITSELTTIIAGIGIDSLKRRFDGKYQKRLTRLLSDQEDEEALAVLGGKWDAKGVMKIIHRHGDEHIIKTILDEGYTIIRFDTAFDKWRYADGSIKENELKGLRGNTLRVDREIRIRDNLSNEATASTLFHEVSHVQSSEPDYLKQEIDVRVETEEFKIRHGLPATKPQYRNPDGTVNRAFIKKEIESSSHYNPVGRKRIGRRYVNEKTVAGWKMP